MNLKICAFPDKISKVKEDYESITLSPFPPCKISDVSFGELQQGDFGNMIAATYFGEKRMEQNIVEIQIYSPYFELNSKKRQIVIIHELIHACQRYYELKEYNIKIHKILRYYKSLQTKYYALGATGNLWVKIKSNYTWIQNLQDVLCNGGWL